MGRWTRWGALLVVLAAVSVNGYMSLGTSAWEVRFAYRHPGLSDEDKIRRKLVPILVDVGRFAGAQSPEGSVILIPPQQAPWLFTGNRFMVSYFVYPRRVVNGPTDHTAGAVDRFLRDHPQVTHVLVTSEGDLWPGARLAAPAQESIMQPGWGILRVRR